MLLCICQKQCCCMLKKCLSTFVARAQFGESGLYGRINYTCNPNALKPKPNQRQENHHYQLSTISSLVFVRKNREALELSSGPVFSAIGTVAGFSEPRCLWSNFFMITGFNFSYFDIFGNLVIYLFVWKLLKGKVYLIKFYNSSFSME